MSGLTWTHGGMWPLLLIGPTLLWLLLFAGHCARVRARTRYGAPLVDRPARPAARATTGALIAALLLLTWMEPRLGEETVAVERRGLDLMFCLDTSRSMLARDLEPDRLARARRDIESVLPELVGGDRVALIAFAGQARLIVPPTHDLDSFRHLLARVDTETVRTGGTDLAAALRRALEVAEEGQERSTAVILLTDGEDLTGAGRQAASELRERGIVLHCAGYGSTRGSKILIRGDGAEEAFLTAADGHEVVSAMDADGLRQMAAAAGGDLVRADVVALPLRELWDKRLRPMLKRGYEAGEEKSYKSRFQWTLLPCLLLLWLDLWWMGGRRR